MEGGGGAQVPFCVDPGDKLTVEPDTLEGNVMVYSTKVVAPGLAQSRGTMR